jgi:hypothetical protein
MYLNPFTPPEIQFISYTDSNENLANVIYYTGAGVGCIINQYNSPYIVEGNEESNCDPLYVTGFGFLDITGTGELYIIKI